MRENHLNITPIKNLTNLFIMIKKGQSHRESNRPAYFQNIILALIILFIIPAMSSCQQADHEKWENLFDSQTLAGWKIMQGAAEFKAEDGMIIGVSMENTPNTFLVTEKKYGDFILEYEMKMDAGLNSGVQIRSKSDPEYRDGRIHGYQVECEDSGRAWAGGIFDEARRGWLYPLEYNKPAKEAYKKEEWNHFRVEAIGNTIRTWINGVPGANLVDDLDAEGFIGLQVHSIRSGSGLAGKTIQWRNIRIITENPESHRWDMPADVAEVSYLTNQLTENEKQNGWKLLWDGETTNGWRGLKLNEFPDKGWHIDNGTLVVEKADDEGSGNGGDIVTTESYRNFIFEIDFNITEGANSGIKYFIQGNSALGCEYQILDDDKHPDAKNGVLGNRTLGSLYDLITADGSFFDPNLRQKRFNGVGSWNRARIEVKGNHVAHYLNGIKIVEYERNTQMWQALVNYSKFKGSSNFGNFDDGHILLQDHYDEVRFRNIKIKPL
jgi:hypothetical protein